jgi:uroporphyrinogen III methyltransferase/synthase
MTPGKVYLVGAGPGDPGLLTLKGKQILERADCVVYDFLVNRDLLRLARGEAEKVCIGRRGEAARMRQSEINRLLVERARKGKLVCRLKGGDPFVFGRGGEEAQALAEAGIAFEVVPGVSAGHAVPAYAGIPITHRDITSTVTFIAGHEDPEKESSRLDWSHLGTCPGTLVFFMAVRNLPRITQALIQHGRNPATPAAVIQWGSLPDQKVIEGTLADIAAQASAVMTPAITVIGEVVSLRERLNWFEHLPLFGKRIVITRAREQAGVLREELAALGAEVMEIPTIEIRPPDSWEPLDAAIRRLEDFHYLLVTSANGVRNFLARLAESGRDVRALKGLTIGAIGPATAAEFARTGVKVDLLPAEYVAEGLLAALGDRDLRGKAFLIPRARVARDLVPRVLEERGARVEVVEAYQTATPKISSEELDRLLSPPPDVITFTSSSTASNLAVLVGKDRLTETLRGVAISSIGPITSQTLRQLGLTVTIEAQESTMAGLVQAIAEYHWNQSQVAPFSNSSFPKISGDWPSEGSKTTKLMGVDLGFSKTRAATGIACFDGERLYLAKAKTPWESRKAQIPEGFRPNLIAIDGPLLPRGTDEKANRIVERVFIRAPFSKRCKPGLGYYGFGLELRRAAAEACAQFSQILDASAKPAGDELVRGDGPIVEAFPNAFLGVLLRDEVFPAPKLKHGKKFDWLYERVLEDKNLIARLSESLSLPGEVWDCMRNETDHDLRAALICLLTAAYAARGTATKVGDAKGGWFWLPPKSLWQSWAKLGLDRAEAKCGTM